MIVPNTTDLLELVGADLGVTDWTEVTQTQVNVFADATGDHQWIHVDVERATREIGSPIAHGYLTLSLLPLLFASAMKVENTRMGVNYGLNKVRFITPVPVGSRVRAHLKLLASDPSPGDGVQQTWEVTVELEGAPKPACVAESLVRRF